MIEKWRPAKTGDSGFIRKRDELTQNWRIDICHSIEESYSGYFIDGNLWCYCEVLEAYLSDEEVESLSCRVAGECTDYGQGTCEQRCAFAREIIEKHFSE